MEGHQPTIHGVPVKKNTGGKTMTTPRKGDPSPPPRYRLQPCRGASPPPGGKGGSELVEPLAGGAGGGWERAKRDVKFTRVARKCVDGSRNDWLAGPYMIVLVALH